MISEGGSEVNEQSEPRRIGWRKIVFGWGEIGCSSAVGERCSEQGIELILVPEIITPFETGQMTQKLAERERVDRHPKVVEKFSVDHGTEEHQVGRVAAYLWVQQKPARFVFAQIIIFRDCFRRVGIEDIPKESFWVEKAMKPHALCTWSAS